MELSVRDFIAELASASPAPGGGTIAAVTGAFAAGLGSMVCGLTIGNDKYPEAQSVLPEVKEVLDKACKRMVELAEEDAAAFNRVMAAFKLPKDTDEEKTIRSDAIQTANLEATRVPLESASCIVSVTEALIQVVRYGNENTLSDCGTAIECAHAAAGGAFMNADINLPSVKDDVIAGELRQKLENLKKKADYFYCSAMELVKAKQAV